MQEILAKILAKYSPNEAEIIQKAYTFGASPHWSKRDSGENYIIHPLSVAQILADFNMDHETVSAGLLHDVLEDTKTTPEILEKNLVQILPFWYDP